MSQPPNKSSNSPKSVSHLAAGFAGGLASAVCLQPLDLLKTRLQQSSDVLRRPRLLELVKAMPSIKSFWVGTLPSVLRTSVGLSLYLTGLNFSRSYLAQQRQYSEPIKRNSLSLLPQIRLYENLITGAFVRGAVGILTMPITVLKTRWESSLYGYTSLSGAIKSIYAEKRSIRPFFLGCGSTIARDAPYAGLYVLLYEQLKLRLPIFIESTNTNNNGSLNYAALGVNSISAMLAAALATVVTTPFDTIKTRIQTEPAKYSNFFGAGASMLRFEGLTVFFRGTSLRLARKTLSAGIAWGVYEEMLKVL